jgi:hypothetical protein
MSCKYLSLVISIYGSILPCKECSYFLCPLYILFLFLDGTHHVGNVRTLDFPSLFLFIDGTHHVGNVRTLDFPSLFLFIDGTHHVGNARTLDFPSLFLFIDGTHHVGNVRTLDFPSLFLFIGVEHGTASRWCELLGTVGTQLLLFCFKPLLKQGIIYTVNYIKSI